MHTSSVDGSRMAQLDLLQGTADLLILKALSWGPAHGYAVARWIERLTESALEVGEGSLYPALHRLERKGWVAAEWKVSDTGRRARFYRLTAAGRRRFKEESVQWEGFVTAVGKVLSARQQPA
jgi:transcriptional regulator